MSSRYVEPRAARRREEVVQGVTQLRIPARRQWFVLAFLPFWLAGWTAGGIAAMRQLAEGFNTFLFFWLCGWAVGWAFAAFTLAAQLGGAEVVRVTNGDLEISNGIGFLRRIWLYRGDTVENLMSYDPEIKTLWGRQGLEKPFFIRPSTGAVKFDHGAETVFLANGVDEPEGRAIVEWLSKRLPRASLA